MPNVVCSVCDVCGVSGQVGLGPDWRQCQRNGQWKANKKTFVSVVLMMTLMMLMTHSYARSHNEILTFSSLVCVGSVSARLVGSSLSGPPARVVHDICFNLMTHSCAHSHNNSFL